MKNPYGQLPFPTELAFEPVQLCNASCFCCPYSWLKDDTTYRGKRMKRRQIATLIEEFGSVRQKYKYRGALTINPFRFSDPLVCQDLDLIFELAEKFNIQIVITTNGAALTKEKLALLNRYHQCMSKLSISLIGCTEEEIKRLMGLNFDKILANLDELANNWPVLRNITRVSLRVINNTPDEKAFLQGLQERFLNKGITIKAIQEQWMTNRIDSEQFAPGEKPQRMEAITQDKKHFVAGCGWSIHLLQRMEIMVDGSVVLCCDDAEKHKAFGNVFKHGIEAIWNGPLRQEHLTILNSKFSESKCGLICSSCTRAVWSDKSVTREDMPHRSLTAATQHANNEGNHTYHLRYQNALLEQAVHTLTLKLRQQEHKKTD